MIHGDAADRGERNFVVSPRAADGCTDVESVARQWLQHSDPCLAAEGLIELLMHWRDTPRAHECVEAAILWLEAADDWNERWAAASSLGRFLARTSRYAQEIIPALLTALEQDEDESVQEECYKALLRQVAPGELGKIQSRDSHEFDRATDVRWDLLAPLRERFVTN